VTDATPIFRTRRKLPVLLLDFNMQRAALMADHAEAVRRCDMRAVHKLQHDLTRVTAQALRKAVGHG
jgi:hypothetical protein